MTEIRRRRWYHRPPVPVVDGPRRSAPIAPARTDVPAAVPAAPLDTPAVLQRLHDYVRVQVRSGVYDPATLRQLTLDAASTETPDPRVADGLAQQVLSSELNAWFADASRWSARTDCDRLDAALAQVTSTGVLVLAGLLDGQAVADSVPEQGTPTGCVAYFVSDVWRVMDTGWLHLTVLDAAGAAAPRTAPVVTAVADAVCEHGLLASTPRTGGVDVAMSWRRRPGL